MKILLIEDDAILSSTLKNLIETEGYRVEIANDGLSGLNKYKNDRFELVITDIILPGKDGMEVISEIRQHDWKTKIIAISGSSSFPSNDFLLMASIMGADVVLTKPFEVEDLILAIKELLSVLEFH